MKRTGRVLLAIAAIITSLVAMYTSATYMLVPFYSTNQNAQYLGPTTLYAPTGEYLYYITTVTSIFYFMEHQDIELYSTVFISANYSIYEDSQCPEHFDVMIAANNPSRLPCAQAFQDRMLFLGLEVNQTNPAFFTSPEDTSQHILKFGSDVPNSEVELYYGLFEFTNVTNCTSTEDCLPVLEYWPTHNGPLQYNREHIVCFNPQSNLDWGQNGCAIPVVIGDTPDCVDEQQRLVCSFAVLYTEFLLPPSMFLIGGMWSWGVIVFFNSMFIFLFVSFLHGRNMHIHYLQNYYFFKNYMSVEGGVRYDYKLVIRGEQFTHSRGTFSVNTSNKTLESVPLEMHFPASEVEDDRNGSVIIRGSYVPERTVDGVFLDILWDEEFQDTDTPCPEFDITFRRHIPKFVKTRWNVVFLPLLMTGVFLRSLCCRDYKLVLVSRLSQNVAFYFLLHASWLVLIAFTILSFFPWHNFSAPFYHMFWGTVEHRPIIPQVLYISYLFCMTGAIIMGFICSRKYVDAQDETSVHHTNSDNLREKNFTVDYGTEHQSSEHVDLLDHATLEYVPMHELTRSTHNHLASESDSLLSGPKGSFPFSWRF